MRVPARVSPGLGGAAMLASWRMACTNAQRVMRVMRCITCRNATKNAKFCKSLVEVIEEADGAATGCPKAKGNLLYYVATKVSYTRTVFACDGAPHEGPCCGRCTNAAANAEVHWLTQSECAICAACTAVYGCTHRRCMPARVLPILACSSLPTPCATGRCCWHTSCQSRSRCVCDMYLGR